MTVQVQAWRTVLAPSQAEKHVMRSNTGAAGNLFSLYEDQFSHQANLMAAVLPHVFMFISTEFYLGEFSAENKMRSMKTGKMLKK